MAYFEPTGMGGAAGPPGTIFLAHMPHLSRILGNGNARTHQPVPMMRVGDVNAKAVFEC